MRGRAAIRSAVAAIVLVAAIGALEVNAHAASPPVALVTAATPLSGGGGWLVWSAPVSGGWALMAFHGGTVERLPVALRAQPFDASVGSDATGAPVVTFSRCARTPKMRPIGEGDGTGGELMEPATGRGCRVRELKLGASAEETLPIPAGPRTSDTSPSMAMGTVTFARHAPAHGNVWQVLSWSPRGPRRLLTLPHGRIPSCPELPHGCRHRPTGTVAALSSDGTTVTFLWELPFGEEGLIGEGAWEVRVDSAKGSLATLAAGAFGHEACTAPFNGPHELESIQPEPPIASGREALFPELDVFSCFQGFGSVLGSHLAAPGHAREGDLEAVVLATADDGGRLYGVVPPATERGPDNPSCTTARPCAIEALATPELRRSPRAPFPPFQ